MAAVTQGSLHFPIRSLGRASIAVAGYKYASVQEESLMQKMSPGIKRPRAQSMGQGSGRPKENKASKLDNYETLADESIKGESHKAALEMSSKQLKAIYGTADLRNGAVGLYNVGLNCCLNSLLQVFFMNRFFTMILRRIKVPFEAAEQKASVPYQMLLLLELMQRAKQKSVYPLDLIRCLSFHDIELFILHDASELYIKLWNLIKCHITDTDLLEHLNLLYTISLKEFLVCQKCLLEIKMDTKMLMLHLPMFDFDCHPVRTLENSLRCFFTAEELMKESMCYCERCDKRTPRLRDMKIAYLPQTLTLHLMRFRSKEGKGIQKVTHSLVFPQTLDFGQILTPEQFHPDAQEKNDWVYELFAVVAHSGSAEFGHYCAYSWSLTERKWYCFNDSSVCQVFWDDIKCTYGKASLYWGETAYLLVYMRKNGGPFGM